MILNRWLLALIIAGGLALAGEARANIVYQVNLPIGAGGVIGTITTDGKTGVLGAADFLSWNMTVFGNDGATQNLVNGPSGCEVGNNTATFNPNAGTPDLTADANHIYFNFSATDGGYFGFQILPFYGGNQYWSCGAHNNNDSYQGLAAVPVLYSDSSSIYEAVSGKQIVASVSNGAPFIIAEPLGTNVSPGESVTLKVVAGGNKTLTYQWFVDGHKLANSSQVAGATATSLTLKNVTANSEGSYDVVVKNHAGSVTSFVAAVTVKGAGNPKLTITSPKSGLKVEGSNSTFTVTGTTTDKVAITDIYYRLNGGTWTPATQKHSSWSNWTATINLSGGTNIVSAYAVDTSGRFSSTNEVEIKFYPTGRLVVIVPANESGHVTPPDNGKWLGLGTNYTLKASPGKNWLFSSWVASGSESFVSNNPALKFTMRPNLTLLANFVPNPFIPEEGTFSGLFMDTNDVTEASSGFFTLTLTTTGSFTGKIMTSGGTYNLPTKTPFDVGGQVQFKVPAKENTLSFNLQLDVNDPSNAQITGTVSDGAWTANLTADRAVFNASNNKAVNYEGHYTLAIAGSDSATTSPGGFGCATLSINSAGLIIMSGNLADGTPISQSVGVSKDGLWPFYASYAAPPLANGGSVFSWITFSNVPASSLGGTMYWFRPRGKTPTVYQSGFSNAVQVMGSAYNPNDKPLLALTSGQVTLDAGDLPFPITNQITLDSDNAITLTEAVENTNKLALTITKTTGAITGTFANPSDPKQNIKVNGVLLQNQTNAAGYFLGTNQSGTFDLDAR
jgi:hypothetical protein